MNLAIDVALRCSIVLFAGLLASTLLRRRSPALRHAVLAMAVLGAPVVLPLGLVLPSIPVSLASGDPPEPATMTVPIPPAAAAPAAAASPSPSIAEPPVPATLRVAWLRLLVSVWGLGAIAALLTLLVACARLARISATGRPVRDPRWVDALERIAGAYGITRRVALVTAPRAYVLATWGWRRPRIAVPANAAAWSDDRIEAVLWHELAHVARHDWPVQLHAEFLRAFLWWNPLTWLACRRLREHSEHACDDAVLTSGMNAGAYASHLVDIARASRHSPTRWATAMPMARSSTLERRILAMLNPTLDRAVLTRRLAWIIATCVLAVLLPVAALRGAQGTTQPLEGVIYDPTGAVVPNVQVTLGEAPKAVQTTTDAAGRFSFPGVDPGTYVLEAKLPGFRALREQVELKENADWDRVVTLQVGAVQETINVRERRVVPQQPSSATTGPGPVRVGGNIRPPKKLVDKKPVYPPSMRDAGREGVVPIEALIGRDGKVTSARVTSAGVHPDFVIAAVDAVRQWQFEPTLLNGQTVEVVMMVSVSFTLE